MSMMFQGLKVTISEPVLHNFEVKRTWKERLFSLSPHRKYKTAQRLQDVMLDGQVLRTEQGLVMNAKTWDSVRRTLKL